MNMRPSGKATPISTKSTPSASSTSRPQASGAKSALPTAVNAKTYRKAKFILKKIAQNQEEGILNVRDTDDRKKYEAIVAAFDSSKAAKSRVEAGKTNKRNRSRDDTSNAPKRSKDASGVSQPVAQGPLKYSDIVKDHLSVALIDESSNCGKPVLEKWPEIEVRLSGLAMESTLANPEGPIPRFDSEEVIRGHRVIRCEDEFSKEFLRRSITEISDAWLGLKLKLIPAKDIPTRPRARIWLPNMRMDRAKLLQYIAIMNPRVPMTNWSVLKFEDVKAVSQPVLFLITEESAKVLEELGCRIHFGVRHAKVKIFRGREPDDDNEGEEPPPE
ncbi:PREDICTED: uncharacterized protein LOC108364564 [Rhagoletis zephyria]|uniref:uncharacterized protein LOC108364564 n=1 Tax=Rhagoletis zephyria TaxID=28612 RepID=UPI00081188E7|nr:PREDICTED: uncharacterized protein LOC108364564 [Rhagoletis zephyria]